VFELTGTPDKIDMFVSLMNELGLVETARTGRHGSRHAPLLKS
jgi:acetolactate synthase-1/3 small subunit